MFCSVFTCAAACFVVCSVYCRCVASDVAVHAMQGVLQGVVQDGANCGLLVLYNYSTLQHTLQHFYAYLNTCTCVHKYIFAVYYMACCRWCCSHAHTAHLRCVYPVLMSFCDVCVWGGGRERDRVKQRTNMKESEREIERECVKVRERTRI